MNESQKDKSSTRIAYAYECALKARQKGLAKKYKSYIKKMPAMIKTNGLALSIAFVFAKMKEPTWELIYSDINNWLKTDHKKILDKSGVKEDRQAELVEKIINLDSINYRLATTETLAFLLWLGKFAEGLEEK